MNTKLKLLGLSLCAVLAMSAFAAMNATGSTPGHFVSSVSHASILGSEGPGSTHRTHLTLDGQEGQIGCTTATYTGTTASPTVESLTVTPSTTGCTTTGTSTAVNITHNGCIYTFTVTQSSSSAIKHILCPVNSKIEIHHPSCTIKIPPQTIANAGIITQTTENGTHALTLDINESVKTEYEGGICIFLGTNHEMSLSGSMTLRAVGTDGAPVGITAT
jgi:hypothetical protein